MTKRYLALAGLLVPLAALVALLVVGMVRSGGKPGGLIVNSRLGEVSVRQGPAPGFSLVLLNGEELRLSDTLGKVVMIDFWASWCPPCREEAPSLARVYKRYQGKGVEFIGVAIWDTEDEAEKFVRRYDVTYPNGLDKRGAIAIDYGVTGIPEKYFLDRSGNLVKKFIGPMEVQDIERVLEELLTR